MKEMENDQGENLHKRIAGQHMRKKNQTGVSRATEATKFDRIVKSGFSKLRESNGFPNYFIA